MEVVARKNVLIRCILMIVSATCVVCRVLVSVLFFQKPILDAYTEYNDLNILESEIYGVKGFKILHNVEKLIQVIHVWPAAAVVCLSMENNVHYTGHHVCIYDDSRKCLMFIINFIYFVSHVTKLVCKNIVL